MKDKFLLGIGAGFGGALVMGILDRLVSLFPGVSTRLIFGVSHLFVPEALVGTLQGNIPAFLASLICGALGGIAFLIVFEKTGYNNPLLKGALLGLMFWFTTCGILNGILNLNVQDGFIDNLMIIFTHLIYGIITGWLLARFRVREKSQI